MLLKKQFVSIGLALSLTILLVALFSSPAQACTGFAVYGNEPIYGMNFDWYYTELRFMAVEGEDTSIFALAFDYEGTWVPTVMVNDKGLFMSNQEQRPASPGKTLLDEGEMYIFGVQAQILQPDVDGVLRNIQGVKLVHWPEMGTHILVADPGGNAAIIEVGDNENEIMLMDGDFMVMTNFKNSDFKNLPYDQVTGTGADRYKIAHEYIAANLEFDIDRAFETLKQATQSFTLCSMVFDPQENSIYLSLSGNFDKVWKVSLEELVLETYTGFEKDVQLKIPEEGISSLDLLAGDFSKYDTVAPKFSWKSGLVVGVVAFTAAVLFIFLKRKGIKSQK